MEGLEAMERLIRNTPAKRIKYEMIDGLHGEIRFAYGRASDGVVYAVWGCCGLARMLEFKSGTKVEAIRQVLVNDAAQITEMRAERGLIGETIQ